VNYLNHHREDDGLTKVPPCSAIDAEYKGYCGIGQRIPSFSELKSICIIMCTCHNNLWKSGG
jgi:hypothetical protein